MRLGFVVKDCGIHFNEIKDWPEELAKGFTVELTEEEKRSPYAKYYYRGIAMPTEENIRAGELYNFLPKEKAFMPGELFEKMTDEFIDGLTSGYCVMDNGIGFTCARVQMRCSDEQFEYFNKNFDPGGNMFYKCWYPGMHCKHYSMGAVEDVGLGMELIHFMGRFIFENDWKLEKGISVKDSLFISLIGLTGISWPVHTPFENERYVLQANWERDLPDGSGRERFTLCWHGLKFENGSFVRAIPEDESAPVEFLRAQMNHAVWEHTQIEPLVKMFWEDNH